MRLISDYPARTGYLLKERLTDGAILRDSLQRIADGEAVIDPTIVAALMNRTRAAVHSTPSPTGSRRCSRWSPKSLADQAIAERLWITERTVSRTCRRSSRSCGSTMRAGAHRRVLAVLAYLRGPHDEH